MTDASVDATVHTFGTDCTYTEQPKSAGENPARGETEEDIADRELTFIQDVENIVCAKISQFVFTPRKRPLEITPSELRGDSHISPLTNARQWCWFILRHHPETRWSFPRIGARFRRYHTTVISGYNRIARLIKQWDSDTNACYLQDACDALSAHGYTLLEVWRVCGLKERPRRKLSAREKTAALREEGRRRMRERNAELLKMKDEGFSNYELADKFCLSLSGVHSVLREHRGTAR